MRKESICCPPANEALRRCGEILSGLGLRVADTYINDMTHLIAPVPTPKEYAGEFLSRSDNPITICGGNIDPSDYETHRVVDFLKDPFYLADNAAITAECAVRLLGEQLPDLFNCRILILGWGRIGKCLGKFLQQIGANVTIAARKESDLAMIHALGYQAAPIRDIHREVRCYDAILNTVPAMILPDLQFDGVAIELASKPGMNGTNIISARGLPGKMAPEKSGELIARTFIRLALSREE